jgi:ATP-independent RNA helicase DbpA
LDSSSFSSLPLFSEILSVVQELGFSKLTPIQEQAIPVLLNGQDLIGRSKTGSGKTAAFAIPILQKIDLKQRTVQALVVCPTRELSTQVAKEIRKFGRKYNQLQVATIYGGVPIKEQAAALDSGSQVVVGTPGRLLDLVSKRILFLGDVGLFILDEADKMLEMGFEDEMASLMNVLPSSRQTAVFSATFPESLMAISKYYQKDPKEIIIEEAADSLSSIEQIVYDYDDSDNKPNILMRILQQHPKDSALIFCNQIATVNELLEMFLAQGVPCGALHGDLEQRDRDRVISLFRNNSHRILIATDVAARGLDIDHLELVVNYDFPAQTDVYVHRIGRTGRAGKSGTAILIAKPIETMKIRELEQATGSKVQRPKLGFKNQHSIGASHSAAVMQTLSISGGRKDKLRPGDILGALTSPALGLKAGDVGKIEILDHYSLVAISAHQAQSVLQKLRESKIKGHKFQVKIVN